MSDLLAGALCVLAAISAGSSRRACAARARGLWEAGAAVIVASAASGATPALAPMAVALVLAAIAGFVAFRFNGSSAAASTQTLLATLAFVAWLLPDASGLNGALAVFAGGGTAALAHLLWLRKGWKSARVQALHLACAGGCAALAYVCGAQSGPLAVVAVVSMVVLIGAHLSLAMGGGAPVANWLSGGASCGLALAAACGGSNGALVVAAVALAIGCAQSAVPGGIVREAP